MQSFIDPSLNWSDLKWFQSITKSEKQFRKLTDSDINPLPLVPIILKGVGCWEDAVLAAEAGVQGIVLSNHGGRQLDMARSGIEVLVEVVDALKLRGLFPNPNFEIYVDGGVRRATDVLKALALGAKAVGLGRPFLYSFCAYGEDGVEHAIKIIRVGVFRLFIHIFVI